MNLSNMKTITQVLPLVNNGILEAHISIYIQMCIILWAACRKQSFVKTVATPWTVVTDN